MDPEKPETSFSERRKNDLKEFSKVMEKNVSEFLSKPPIKKNVGKIKKFYHNQIGGDTSNKTEHTQAKEDNFGPRTTVAFVNKPKSSTEDDDNKPEETSHISYEPKMQSYQTSSSSMSHVSSSQDWYHYSSFEYEEASYEAPNYVLEDMAKTFNNTTSESSPPGLPPRNLPPRPSQEALAKLHSQEETIRWCSVQSSISTPSPHHGNVEHKQATQNASESVPPPIPLKNSPLSWESPAPTLSNNSNMKITQFSQIKSYQEQHSNKSSSATSHKHQEKNYEHSLDESLSIGQEHKKLPRSPSKALKSKMEQMAKTFKGSSISSITLRKHSYQKDVRKQDNISVGRGGRNYFTDPDSTSKRLHSSQSSMSSTSSLPRASRSSDATPAMQSRPPSVLVQKLESALRNVPALMLVGQNDWIRDEPMYQFYAATANHFHVNMDGNNEEEGFYDMYQEWPHWPENDYYNSSGIYRAENVEKVNESSTRKSDLATADKEIIVTQNMVARTLWSDLKVVQDNTAACSLSKQQKKLQEIKFEILTTEASYIKSLNVLQDHFIKSPELSHESVLSENECRILFQEVQTVHDCSLAFMADVEMCWKESIFLRGIFDVILTHCNDNFHVYIEYCTHQSCMAETYKSLIEKNSEFLSAIKRLESHPDSCRLPLHSFLLLPLQRITRLLLLVEAALQCLEKNDSEYLACQAATNQLRQIVYDCNEGARISTRRRERMAKLREQLDYRPGVKPFSMTSATRWLIMSGDMTKYDVKAEEAMFSLSRNKNKLTHKITKSTVCLFLLSDLLVLTKKKSDDSYTVLDYGLRTVVRVDEGRNIEYLPQQLKTDAPKKYILIISIFENHEHKYTEMILSCTLESDRDRWLEAMTPHTVKHTMRTKERKLTSQKPTTHATHRQEIDISPNITQEPHIMQEKQEEVNKKKNHNQQQAVSQLQMESLELNVSQLHGEHIKELQNKLKNKAEAVFV